MRPRRVIIPLGLVALAACDRDTPSRIKTDSVTVDSATAPAPAPVAAPRVSGWSTEAGRGLLIHGDGGEALVVIPGQPGDSAVDVGAGSAESVLPGEVTLFSRGGGVAHARAELVAGGATGDCVRWPTARLAPAAGSEAVPPWTVGFVGGTAAPLALDSLETATPVDSAGLAAAVTRLASSLSDDTVRALRGVPFRVRSARRFALPGNQQGVVAVLTRALNEEASPISEQVLLVAERPAGAAASSGWTLAYHERTSGKEDEMTATDVLAAVALGAAQRPTLVLARALSDGNRYALLERTGDRSWRVRWTSVEGGC